MAFVVKIQELNSAADAYSKAATAYETSYTKITKAMNIAEGSWSDQAGESWRQIAAEAEQELQKLKSTLDANKALLAEVARAAGETQAKVTSGIQSIY